LKSQAPGLILGVGAKDGKIEKMATDIKKDYIKEKFKNVSAISFSTYHKELMINFTGFESQEDLKEFADFVFAKIKMRYSHMEDPPTIH